MVAPLNELIDEFLERGDPVYKCRDWHPPKTKHFEAHGGAWPIHCVQNTKGAEFHPQLKEDPRNRVISKGLGDTDCYSAQRSFYLKSTSFLFLFCLFVA